MTNFPPGFQLSFRSSILKCLTKTQIKYLKHFITIKLLEKADFLGIVD